MTSRSIWGYSTSTEARMREAQSQGMGTGDTKTWVQILSPLLPLLMTLDMYFPMCQFPYL